MTRGKFISFEGGEGSGKSTQVGRLVERLQPVLGERNVVRTREPGGSKGAEVIRNLVVATEAEPWSAMTETLLMYASRSDHLERTIRPALEAGAWAVHIPYHITWAHELADAPEGHARYGVLESIRDLPQWIADREGA